MGFLQKTWHADTKCGKRPPPSCHMNRFYWGWGWSSICWLKTLRPLTAVVSQRQQPKPREDSCPEFYSESQKRRLTTILEGVLKEFEGRCAWLEAFSVSTILPPKAPWLRHPNNSIDNCPHPSFDQQVSDFFGAELRWGSTVVGDQVGQLVTWFGKEQVSGFANLTLSWNTRARAKLWWLDQQSWGGQILYPPYSPRGGGRIKEGGVFKNPAAGGFKYTPLKNAFCPNMGGGGI